MEHPVVGAWTVTFKSSGRFGPDLATAAFHPEGTMTITISGYTAHGVWRAADPATARFRAVAPLAASEGQTGWHTLTFTLGVSPDGTGLSFDGAHERPTPSGQPSVTTITGTGQRMMLDPGS